MSTASPPRRVDPALAAAVDEAYQRGNGARWALARETFAAAIDSAVTRRYPTGCDGVTAATFVGGLHAEDLALACACAEGHDAAWDHFVLTFRPELYRAARAMTDEATGRELADSLYADLFGLPGTDGRRRSLFRYYHGRSRLGAWLRSVLAQRHVDLVRSRRRLTSLDDPEHPQAEPVAPAPGVEPDEAHRMREAAAAVSEALRALAPQDRLRLAYYYVHGLTLAQTGTLFGEHEATASRKLEKARKTVKQGIVEALAARGARAEDVESWGAVAREAWHAALAEALGVAAPPGTQAPGPASFKEERTP